MTKSKKILISRDHTECSFFSHVASQCFLLTTCDSTEPCEGCLSGPPLPTISQCQNTCEDFGEGLCNFAGNNLIDTLSTTDVELCQSACRWDEKIDDLMENIFNE